VCVVRCGVVRGRFGFRRRKSGQRERDSDEDVMRTRGTGSISRIDQLSRQRPQSTRIIHRQREIDEVNVPGTGWLARAERGRRQRSTTTKGCLRRQTRGSRGREGQDSPRPWLTKTQEHPVQAPAALWIAGIFELTSKGYRDQNTDLATRD
jgi:hypothetical protein